MQFPAALVHYVLSGCIFVGSVVTSVLKENNVPVHVDDVWKKLNLKCNLVCPYGFMADIEGRHICKCYEPCYAVYCRRGTECVAEFPKDCSWEPCKAIAFCRPVKSADKEKVHKDHEKYKSDLERLLNYPQQDAADTSLSSADTEDICSKPLADDAFNCSRRRRRWYYSPVTGKCARFMGCDTEGNNFSRKFYCKSTCRRRRVFAKRSHRRSKEGSGFELR